MHLISVQNEATKVRPDAVVIRIHVCHRSNSHLHIVMIKSECRLASLAEKEAEYIVWTFNIGTAGLSHGNYNMTFDEARLEFERRVSLYDRAE